MKIESVSTTPGSHPSTHPLTNPQLHVYPIKGLREVPLKAAELTPQGIKHDRRFMLWTLKPDGSLGVKMQVVNKPEVSLFRQDIVGDDSLNEYAQTPDAGSGPAPGEKDHEKVSEPSIVVRYITPKEPLTPHHPAQDTTLTVPLNPDTSSLQAVEVDMNLSKATAYRMGSFYDEWFSSCLGYPAALLYIGDGRRPQLGFQPGTRTPRNNLQLLASYVSSLFLRLLSLVGLGAVGDWIVFTDLAPFLITSTASLSDVSSRIEGGVGMHRFRPNIVVGPDSPGSGDLPSWSEDFWSQLTISPPTEKRAATMLQVTGNCCRCASVNMDYDTGRPSEGPSGVVLKKMMADRRVDEGRRHTAVFGRYASLFGASGGEIRVGDGVEARMKEERDVWDWPDWNKKKPKAE